MAEEKAASSFPNPNNKCFVCLYELIGTAVLIGALNISGGKAEAVSIALFCIAIFLGPVSGGHVNPAVTLAVFIAEKDLGNLLYMCMIWISQIVGAFIGISIAWSAQTYEGDVPKPGLANLCPNKAISVYNNATEIYQCAPKDGTAGFNVFLVEMIGTAIFISVIMSVVYFNGASGPLNALAIGGTLYGMAKTIGGISGGCLNPAVGLAQTIVQRMAYKGKPNNKV